MPYYTPYTSYTLIKIYTTTVWPRWSDDDDATLVGKLRWVKENGYQSNSGWKIEVWALCIEVLKDSPGPPKVADKVQDHWGNSGFGWDDGLKMVTASDNVWEAYLAHWHNREFVMRYLGHCALTILSNFTVDLGQVAFLLVRELFDKYKRHGIFGRQCNPGPNPENRHLLLVIHGSLGRWQSPQNCAQA
ncbi:hypothetical protein B0H11DRAFT_2367199 [Mycena galericulata]|nr:hypothetical protein B0H11DRAFT_2367199 [Mycena galericulata]